MAGQGGAAVSILTMVVPLLLCAVALWGNAQRVDVFDALTVGAGEGLQSPERNIGDRVKYI